MCLCFDNLTGRVFPELIARAQRAGPGPARPCHRAVLPAARSRSSATHDDHGHRHAGCGARDPDPGRPVSLRRFGTATASRRTQSFRVIIPYWVKDMIRSDIAMQMPGDGGTNFTAADNDARPVVPGAQHQRHLVAGVRVATPPAPDDDRQPRQQLRLVARPRSSGTCSPRAPGWCSTAARSTSV